VLNGKKTKQAGIDEQGSGERPCRPGINALRNYNVTDESNGIQESAKENQVAQYSINKPCYSSDHKTSFEELDVGRRRPRFYVASIPLIVNRLRMPVLVILHTSFDLSPY